MRVLPPDRDADQRSLARALDLAEQARAFASPNPTVGCVLLRDGVVLGEGAHRYDQRDHAEIVALKAARAAGHDAAGATAFVTLEPCSHHGRTGPCADALVVAGIARCVVATIDPNPLVRGGGLAKLRAAGIAVDLLPPGHPQAQRARRLNDAFAFSVQHGRPLVTLKAAVSRDGKLAPPAATRSAAQPFWLTGPAARADVQQLRHAADALLTGIGTVLADDPELTDRTGLPRRRPLLRVVLDSTLRLPETSALVRHAADDLLVICDETADRTRLHALRQHRLEIEPLPALRSPDTLQVIFERLQARGIRSVLTEAGTALNGALLRADLADRIVLYIANRELGSDALPFAAGAAPPEVLANQLAEPTRRTFPHGESEDIRLAGYLHDPWAGF